MRPFVASWSARIPAGSRYDEPVIALDIGRTAVEHAGGDSQSGKPMEGVDLLPFVLGEKQGPPHEALFWRTADERWAILAPDGAKAVQNSPGKEPELYLLPDDISEKNDLMAAQPERYETLRRGWEAWNKKNIPARFPGYRDYHVERNKFFREVLRNETESKAKPRK